jgi:hypothetical protein
MAELEQAVLRFVAGEVFCPVADIEAFIQRETGGTPEEAAATALALLTEWEDRGWAETAEMDPAGQVSLTDQAFADLPWLPRQP